MLSSADLETGDSRVLVRGAVSGYPVRPAAEGGPEEDPRMTEKAVERVVEKVLVSERSVLFREPSGAPQGLVLEPVARWLDIAARHAFFVDRAEAEDAPRWKQWIPYGVLTWKDNVFLMRRRRGGGEHRLHDLLSVGVGGHVNPPDDRPGVPGERLERALRREIEEELHLDGPWSVEPLGILNDDSNPVGRVHFGVVYRIRATSDRVRVRETAQLEGRFVPAATLASRRRDMETWSSLLVASLWPGPSSDREAPRR